MRRSPKAGAHRAPPWAAALMLFAGAWLGPRSQPLRYAADRSAREATPAAASARPAAPARALAPSTTGVHRVVAPTAHLPVPADRAVVARVPRIAAMPSPARRGAPGAARLARGYDAAAPPSSLR